MPYTKFAPPQQQEMVLRQEARDGTPSAVVGRVAGSWVTYCYDTPGGPISGGSGLTDAPVTETRIVTSDRRHPEAGREPVWLGPDVLIVALLTVAPDVGRVEITAEPRPGSDATATPCTVADGLALCMLRGTQPGSIRDDGAVTVRAYVGEEPVALPVP